MPKNFLKKIREEKGISQSKLASSVGVSKQLLSGFENGRSGVSNEVLGKIAKFLGVSSDYVLSGKNKGVVDGKDKENLAKAMSMAFDFYGEEFDKDTLIKIATQIYVLMVDFDDIRDDDGKIKSFKNHLAEDVANGLAAKCFLDSMFKKNN